MNFNHIGHILKKTFSDAGLTRDRSRILTRAETIWDDKFKEKYAERARISDYSRGVLFIVAQDSATQQEILQFDKDIILASMSESIKKIKTIKVILEKTHVG